MDVDHVEAGVGGTSQCQALSLVAVLVSRLPECLRRVVGETAHHGLTGRRLYVHARSEVFQSLNKTVHLDTVKQRVLISLILLQNKFLTFGQILAEYKNHYFAM